MVAGGCGGKEGLTRPAAAAGHQGAAHSQRRRGVQGQRMGWGSLRPQAEGTTPAGRPIGSGPLPPRPDSGWEFNGQGGCEAIPQLGDEKAKAAAIASPRSCVTSYPVKVCGACAPPCKAMPCRAQGQPAAPPGCVCVWVWCSTSKRACVGWGPAKANASHAALGQRPLASQRSAGLQVGAARAQRRPLPASQARSLTPGPAKPLTAGIHPLPTRWPPGRRIRACCGCGPTRRPPPPPLRRTPPLRSTTWATRGRRARARGSCGTCPSAWKP